MKSQKVCKACGSTEFYKHGGCKPCAKARVKKWVTNNQEKAKGYKATYRLTNTEKIKTSNAVYRMANQINISDKQSAYYFANLDKERKRSADYRSNNKDKIKKRNAAYYLANSEKIKSYQIKHCLVNAEKKKAVNSAYRLHNQEKIKESNAAYRLNNPKKIKESASKWQKNNPEKNRIACQNRRAKKRHNGGRLSKDIAQKLFILQKGRCACCNKQLGSNYHLDHIMPVALGGSNTDDNIQLLRATCNQKKSATHPIDFMQSKGFLI